MKVILTGKFDLETTEEMYGWSREYVRQWALAHLQNLDLEVFDWDVEFDDAIEKAYLYFDDEEYEEDDQT